MSSTASQPVRTGVSTGPEAAAWAERLRVANINPRTGLATDYLNHFNEAVMLLEMVPDMPECAEDFLTWTPLSYAEHFTASNFKARDLAIEAYERADPAAGQRIEPLGGRAGAAGQKHLAVTKNRRADRDLGTLGLDDCGHLLRGPGS